MKNGHDVYIYNIYEISNELKLGHIGSKTRLTELKVEEPCEHSGGHIFIQSS